MDLKNFVQHLLSEGIEVKTDEQYLKLQQTNVTGYENTILAEVFPADTSQVQKVVLAARQFKIPLYPVSTGKNIGLGSKAPYNPAAVTVNLSRMNRILEVNDEFGYAVVEPGVTQQQLADYLDSHNSKFFLDATGAPAGTSVIGNILDKGIAYNSARFEYAIDFQVVLGTGEIIETGYLHFKTSKLKHIYRYASGPDLTGLFIQSNYGIVTRAAIRLMYRQPYHAAFLLSLSDESVLGEVAETIKELKLLNLTRSVVHIGNRHRSFISLAPMVYRYMKSIGKPISRQEAEDFLEDFLPGAWSLIGSVSGPKNFVKAALSVIKSKLKHYGKFSVIDQEKVKTAIALSKYLGMKKLNIYLNSISPLVGLTFGKPTDEAIHSIYWPRATEYEDWLNIDRSGKFGFIYVVPVVPLSAGHIREATGIIKDIEKKYGFKIAVTLNTINDFALEGVVSFDFDLTNAQETEKAHQAGAEMIERFVKQGYTPYRIDIANMDKLLDPDSVYWQKIAEMKKVFDPDNVIAPSRFNLV